MHHVLNSEKYGFPLNQNGFYSTNDFENEIHTVDRDVSAEAYLWIVTKDGEILRSTSILPNERDEKSYLIINKVIEGSTSDKFKYIVEGNFSVNLFIGQYGTESEMVEGTFRLPIVEVKNSELLELCN